MKLLKELFKYIANLVFYHCTVGDFQNLAEINLEILFFRHFLIFLKLNLLV